MKRGGENNIKKIVEPIKVNFDLHDLLQVIIGASILAVPVGFTEETWGLGETLPLFNIFLLMGLTLFFIAIFTFLHYHKEHMNANPKYHIFELLKRVFVTYIMSFIIVALLLWIIQVTPWASDSLLAFKRIVVVTFPSALGGAISDTIK